MTIPFLRNRRLYPEKEDLRKMLLINDSEKPMALEELSQKLQAQLKEINTGSVAFIFEEKTAEDQFGFSYSSSSLSWT